MFPRVILFLYPFCIVSEKLLADHVFRQCDVVRGKNMIFGFVEPKVRSFKDFTSVYLYETLIPCKMNVIWSFEGWISK